MAEHETTASLDDLTLVTSHSPHMTTLDIATTDGDVVLDLGEARLRVSSVILSSASQVFKAMLGPNFLEGQGNRSAQNPKEIKLFDDDIAAMTRLCRLLHHQDDIAAAPHDQDSLVAGAKQLLTLTALADKYGCIGSIRPAGGYMLSHSSSSSLCATTTVETLLRLVIAAYMLDDSRHFALFTRRMVLGTARPYSLLAHNPDFAALPNTLLLLLGGQRQAATMALRFELPKLAEQRCYRVGCGRTGTDLTFANALAQKMNDPSDQHELYWPPLDNTWSLRSLLKKAFRCGDVDIHLATGCKHEHDFEHKVTGESMRSLCTKVSKIACGLCLQCLQHNRTNPATCAHRQLLEQWIDSDPIS